jgi:uncharacterized protein YutE (UPF0331/DUF86 family)
MLDKERVLIKIDELKGYLEELKNVRPSNFEEYKKTEKKRSCERLLQLCVECVIDICKIIVSGLRLGVPYEENDLFNKLFNRKIIDEKTLDMLKEMRGFRNILVHEYAEVDDRIVFESLYKSLNNFEVFIKAILDFIRIT